MPQAYVCNQCGNIAMGKGMCPSTFEWWEGECYCSKQCVSDHIQGVPRSPKYKHNIAQKIDIWLSSKVTPSMA